jgi:hypothetical protein
VTGCADDTDGCDVGAGRDGAPALRGAGAEPRLLGAVRRAEVKREAQPSVAVGAGRSPFAELEGHVKLDVVEEQRFHNGALAQILVPKQ